VTNEIIGLLCLGGTIGLIVLGLPIAFSMGIMAVVGILQIAGLRTAIGVMKTAPFELASSWELSAIPMFILMGTIAFHSGMTASLFNAARLWLYRLPGGLAVATNFACAGFAAASGSSLATTIAMGRLTIPEMRRYNYDVGLATGVTAAAGTLGSLIPPSILLVIYGVFAEVSIPKLFIAGILPGILTAAAYAGMIVIRCMVNPSLAPASEVGGDPRAKWRALADVWPLPLLVVLVIGTIYAGIATPTEAGAFGAVFAMLIALIMGKLNWRVIYESLRESILSSAAIFIVAIAAMLMTRLMSYSGAPAYLSQILGPFMGSPLSLVLALAVMYLLLGCVLDSSGMVFLTLPVVLPLLIQLDVDLIWFGILLVKFVEIGMITPPVGMNVFAVKALTPDVPLGLIFRGVTWFVATEIAVTGLIIAFPIIALLLVP